MYNDVMTEILHREDGDFLKVTLEDTDFYLPFLMISGIRVAFLDVSGQVLMIEKTADLLVKRLKEAGVEFDTILNPVSKSNALAHAVAVRWAAEVNPAITHTVVARKGKPGDTHEYSVTYKSVTTSAEQTLYITETDAAEMKGKRVLMMDDVYGGGGTTKALKSLVEQTGAVIAGHAVAAVEDSGRVPEGLIYLYELPVLP